ncbi:aldo/keto reductase [Streptomyces sp. NPDC035033]|uniref:aldo/keto reductase n=1 Tax=Streptomyces sp. NPDC035033 TaxID=3155368 RepID=UPI0033F20506
MNLSHAYGVAPSTEDAERLLLTALEEGVTLFDTAALYGFGTNEELVGRVLARHRARIVLASKCGMTGVDGRRVIDGRPETLRRTVDEALARLRTDAIDLYYLHRLDRAVPVEESVGAMAGLVEAGKVRALGLSEVSAATLRRAHAVHPIAALQNEYSLWTRNPERGTLEAARELGVALVAFSPLARGSSPTRPRTSAPFPRVTFAGACPASTSATIRATWRCGASWRRSPAAPASPCHRPLGRRRPVTPEAVDKRPPPLFSCTEPLPARGQGGRCQDGSYSLYAPGGQDGPDTG